MKGLAPPNTLMHVHSAACHKVSYSNPQVLATTTREAPPAVWSTTSTTTTTTSATVDEGPAFTMPPVAGMPSTHHPTGGTVPPKAEGAKAEVEEEEQGASNRGNAASRVGTPAFAANVAAIRAGVGSMASSESPGELREAMRGVVSTRTRRYSGDFGGKPLSCMPICAYPPCLHHTCTTLRHSDQDTDNHEAC